MTRLTWLAAPLLALALGATACQTDADFSISMLFAMRIKLMDNLCETDKPAKSGVEIITQGVFDPTSAGGYILAPLLVNGSLPADEAPNAHIMYVQGIDTEIRAANEASSQQLVAALVSMNMDKRTQLFDVGIPPLGLVAPIIGIIDLEQSDAIQRVLAGLNTPTGSTTIVVHMRTFGIMDDATVEGAPFDFPLTVCTGCLLEPLGPCANLPTNGSYAQGGSCGLPQDGVLSCCTADDGVSQVCPAVGTKMPTMTTRTVTAPSAP